MVQLLLQESVDDNAFRNSKQKYGRNEKVNNDEEVMSAEEFFGELEYEKKAPVRKGRRRGRKSANDLFAEIKVKMVMRIYGVTKARALEILADRAEEKDTPPAPDGDANVADDNDDDDDVKFLPASEFFGVRL